MTCFKGGSTLPAVLLLLTPTSCTTSTSENKRLDHFKQKKRKDLNRFYIHRLLQQLEERTYLKQYIPTNQNDSIFIYRNIQDFLGLPAIFTLNEHNSNWWKQTYKCIDGKHRMNHSRDNTFLYVRPAEE